MFDITQLRLNPNNPFPFRGDDQEWKDFVQKLERDPEFLDARPIIYDSSNDNLVIAGNKRTKGLLELGFKSIPENRVLDCKDWSEEKKRRFELADNWHPSGSEWDVEFITEDEAHEWGIEFGFAESTDYSTKNKEIDVDDFDDKMSITLNYTENEYRRVKNGLLELAKTPEAAIWQLLGYE